MILRPLVTLTSKRIIFFLLDQLFSPGICNGTRSRPDPNVCPHLMSDTEQWGETTLMWRVLSPKLLQFITRAAYYATKLLFRIEPSFRLAPSPREAATVSQSLQVFYTLASVMPHCYPCEHLHQWSEPLVSVFTEASCPKMQMYTHT